MASLSITALFAFFKNESKSVSRGENHYKSGHVLSYSYSEGIISGKVRASMKNKEYSVTIQLNDSLNIISTSCQCPRGVYKCSHAAALYIHSIHNISRTDVPCQWKKKVADEVVKTAEDLFPKKKEYVAVSREPCEDDRNWLYQQLQGYGQFTGLCWLMAPEPDQQQMDLPLLEVVLTSKEFQEASEKKKFFLEKMELTKENIVKMSQVTVLQSRNDAWHMLRKGRLTASNFGPVLQARKVTQALIKRVLGEYDLSGVKAVMWGNNNEVEAIKAFKSKTGYDVQSTGIWLDSTGLLGASPDGLVGDDGILEVKCPFSHRNPTIAECLQDNTFCLEQNCEELTLKKSHQYWHQVQGQLQLTDRQLCFFVVWTLKDVHIEKIMRDDTWVSNMALLRTFYMNNLFPRLTAS